MEQLLTTGEVARLLGLRVHQITYAFTARLLAEPSLRVMNKRLYTPEAVKRVGAHFGFTGQGEQVGTSDKKNEQ